MRAVHKPVYTPSEQVYLDWYNNNVPLWLYTGILIVLLSAGIVNLVTRLLSNRNIRKYKTLYKPSVNDRMGRTSWRWVSQACGAWWRKKTYRRNKVAEFLGMESAAQIGIILGYYLLNFAIAFSGASGKLDYQAHHCARLFNSNLPLVVGLAAKDLSFISWISSISLDTLNIFHRWVARLLLILACIHIGGRVYTNDPPVNPTLPHSRYQAWGIAAFVFFSILILGSTRPIRVRWFKVFMMGHIGIFVLALVTLSVHRPQVAPYTIAALVLYVSDRVVRGVSLIYYNFFKGVVSNAAGYLEGPPSCTVQILTHDTLRITFHTARKWTPGQHSYLHFPLISAGGHPFSIITIPSSPQVFLIRVRSGLTKLLRDVALRGGGGTDGAVVPLWPAWVEGPFGGGLRVERFETVLLVTGGSGVGFATALVAGLVAKWREETKPGLVTRRVVWVWVVKEPAHIEWISDILSDVLDGSDGLLSCRFHVTNSSQAIIEGEEIGEDRRLLRAGELEHPQEKIDEERGLAVGSYSNSIATASESNLPSLSPYHLDGAEISATSPTSHDDVVEEYLVLLPSSNGRSAQEGESDEFTRPVRPSQEFAKFASTHSYSSSTLRTSPTVALDEAKTQPEVYTHWTTTKLDGNKITIPLFIGRPNIKALVDEVISESDYSDTVWVGTCGPKGMTSEVGSVVADAIDIDKACMGEHRRNPRFHSEMFGW